MKSLRYLLILLIVLTFLAVILVLKNQRSAIPAGIKNVSVENTSEIDRIVISSGNNKISLEKENEGWRLNDSFEAKINAIDLMMNMLQRLEIAAPVSRSQQNLTAKKLINAGRHVQIYKGNRVIRSFYIGYDTTGIRGTIFLKEGSKTPFFLKLKGYSLSDISLLFSPDIRFWRDNTLFNYQPSDISDIQVEYPGSLSQSFEIIAGTENRPVLVNKSTGKIMNNADNKSILNYLYYFSGVKYQLTENDSIPAPGKNLLFAEIKIRDVSNTLVHIKLFRKTNRLSSPDMHQFDLNQCYGKINDEEEIITIRYVDIDPILRELDDFLKK
jgi:hypothetical protein